MASDTDSRTISTTWWVVLYPRFLFLVVLFVLFETATSTPLFAQDRTQAETKPRVSLGVLIDTSPHQKKVIDFQREAVTSIADAFAGRATESFVIRYGDEVALLQDWAPVDTGLRTAARRITLDVESGKDQRTLLYEALNAALLKLELGNSANSKVLIVIGEGNNAGGSIKYGEIKKRARAAHVQCFVLLVADHNLMGGRVRHYGFYLYDLAWATKGNAYDIERSRKKLDKAIRNVLKRVQ